MIPKVSYIQFVKNHHNSKNELAEWVIKSHKTEEILSSHTSKEKAEKHLREMHYHKGALTFQEIQKVAHCGPCSPDKGWAIQQLSDTYFKDKEAVDNNLVGELAKLMGATSDQTPFINKLNQAIDQLKARRDDKGEPKYADLVTKLSQIAATLSDIQTKLDEGEFTVVDKEDTKKGPEKEAALVYTEVQEATLRSRHLS